MNRTDLIRHLEAHDLPEGWAETTVRQVAEDISYGFTAKASNSETGPRYLRITDLQNGTVDWGSVPSCRIPKEKIQKYLLRRSDIVFARTGATTGKSFLVGSCPEAVFASYLIRVRPSRCVLPEFLAFFFQTASYWNQISENISGSAQPNCNATKLASLTLPVPSLDEQQRIVAKLEEVFGNLEACEKRLKKIPVILKRFRQSVLAAACSGRLTPDWRRQYPESEQAPAIVDKLRESRMSKAKSFAEKEKLTRIYERIEENDSNALPDSWRFVALNKLCGSFDYGTSAKSKPSGDVAVLRMGNVQNGRIDWPDLVYTSDKHEIQKYTLKPGTVLFNRTNSPELVGKAAIYRGERPAIFAGYLIRINVSDVLSADYLNYCLSTNHARDFCLSVKTDGVSQSNINAQKLGTFEVPFCSLKEQIEIVTRVDFLFEFADQIEARYKKAQAQVDKLTQSILAKAFRGELVPTEAELARREGRVRTRLNSSGSSTQGTCPAGQTKARRVARGVKQ